MGENDTTNWVGLAARSWDSLGGDEPGDDYAFYLDRLLERGGAALDVGCGTGRLLVRLLQAGVDIDGVDTSQDMLEICAEKAVSRDLEARLFHQNMLELELPRAYRTIIIPCGSFMLLCTDEQAVAGLRSLRSVLDSKGQLVFSCFGPNAPPRPTLGEWYQRATATMADNTQISMDICVESYDKETHVVHSRRRYTRTSNGETVEEEFLDDTYRWYPPEPVIELLREAGFDTVNAFGSYDLKPLDDESEIALFLAE